MTDQREPPAPTEQADPLLDTAQVAEKLGVSEETVRRYARTGSIASIRLPGGTRRFKTSVIDAVLAGPTEGPTTQFQPRWQDSPHECEDPHSCTRTGPHQMPEPVRAD